MWFGRPDGSYLAFLTEIHDHNRSANLRGLESHYKDEDILFGRLQFGNCGRTEQTRTLAFAIDRPGKVVESIEASAARVSDQDPRDERAGLIRDFKERRLHFQSISFFSLSSIALNYLDMADMDESRWMLISMRQRIQEI